MSYFQPTDLSGCFLFYRPTDIGLTTDGALITYWPDMSGSGNHLTPVASSTTYFPTFKTNIVNGYPVARFNGSSNYLQKNNNPTLNLSPSSLTLFVVYQTFSDVQTQILCSNDNTGGKAARCSFTQILNYGGVASGWHYAWGKDTQQFGENIITASYNGNNQLFTKNEFLIRTDFFHPITQMFTWARSSTQISSGVGSMSTSTANNFHLGTSEEMLATYFNGDIAEVIGYNRMLSLSEIDQVHSYLLYKYALDPTQQCPLFVWGVGPPESGIYTDITLTISGSAPISSGFSLYEQGVGPINFSTTLYTESTNTSNSGVRLYIGSTTPINSSLPLYSYAISSGNSSFSLYINSSTSISGGINLYEFGVFKDNSNISLFIYPRDQIPSGHITLFENCSNLTPSGFSLYMSGMTYTSLQTPLYIIAGTEVNSFPLYSYGYDNSSGNISLYISSSIGNSGSFTLYTFPKASGVGGIPLYVQNIPPTIYSGINHFNLVIDGCSPDTSGLNVGTTLFMCGLGQYAQMPLFISTDPLVTSGSDSSFMPLFIYGPQTTGTNSFATTLFVQNNTQVQNSPRLKLWIKGDGVMDGASIFNDNMNLVVNTLHGQYNYIPLYMGSTTIPNSSLPLFINTTFNINSGVSMFVEGEEHSGSISLFMNAGDVINSGISLMVSGLPTISSNISMYSHGY